MFFSLIAAVCMIDAVPQDIPPIIALQRGMMASFFRNVSPDEMRQISRGVALTNICDWHRTNLRCRGFVTPSMYADPNYEPPQREDPLVLIGCTDGVLRGITLTERDYKYAIRYLPNTLEEIEITDANYPYALDTRELPARARKVDLARNRIEGPIDLCTLPSGLEWFSVKVNDIWGTVALTNVPRGLKTLILSLNEIEPRILYYDNLPPGFQAFIDDNRIGRIRSITPGRRAPKGTFYGISAWHRAARNAHAPGSFILYSDLLSEFSLATNASVLIIVVGFSLVTATESRGHLTKTTIESIQVVEQPSD